MIKPIIGKKVVLFEIQPVDFTAFAKAHREDEKGYMQKLCLKRMTQEEAEGYVGMLVYSLQLQAFTVLTKEGKSSRRAGFVYISDLSETGCQVGGIMTKEFMAGLSRQIKRGKYTYSEDSLVTLINWCFATFPKMNRIEIDVVEENKLSLALVERAGFTKEGTLRDYLTIDGDTKNVVVHSILKKEWGSRVLKAETADNHVAGVQSPDAAVV